MIFKKKYIGMDVVKKLYNRRIQLIKKLTTWGYIIPEAYKISLRDFQILYDKDAHHIYMEKIEYKGEQVNIYIYWEKGQDMKKRTLEMTMKRIEEELGENKFKELYKIYLVLDYAQPNQKSSLNVTSNIQNDDIYHNVVVLKDIYAFDISKNINYPMYVQLIQDKEFIQKYFHYYKIKPEQAKHIHIHDPLVKNVNGKEGELLYIVKQNGNFDFRLIVSKLT